MKTGDEIIYHCPKTNCKFPGTIVSLTGNDFADTHANVRLGKDYWQHSEVRAGEPLTQDSILYRVDLYNLKPRRPTKPDPVNRPSHYTAGGIEVIDAIEAWGLGFALGNAVKYIARAGKKDPSKTVEDLRKARWYLDREVALHERKKP